MCGKKIVDCFWFTNIHYKQCMGIIKIYDINKNKLISSENRKFLIQSIYVAEKKLPVKYNNRQYTEEELKSIVK